MRLLICTQAIDTKDPTLGFFHRWVQEFAKHCEHVVVLAQRVGAHSLPNNVTVLSLGKEEKLSRPAQLLRFFRYMWRNKDRHDAVLVHMSPEYVLAGGVWWRLWGKKIMLWYTHKDVSVRLRVATYLSNIVITASKESFRLATRKVRVMGHGIDTDFFMPDPQVPRELFLLSVGRLMPSKRHDLAIRSAAEAGKPLHIAGNGPERAQLEALSHKISARVTFLGGISQEALREEYRRAELLLHYSETGSLDKVVLEALACGLPVRTADRALKFLESEGPSYVREHHSLSRLIPAMLKELA